MPVKAADSPALNLNPQPIAKYTIPSMGIKIHGILGVLVGRAASAPENTIPKKTNQTKSLQRNAVFINF